MILKYFLPFSGLPYYSIAVVFWCIKFLFHEVQCAYFFFRYLYLWCYTQEIITIFNIVKVFSYGLKKNIFRSYI